VEVDPLRVNYSDVSRSKFPPSLIEGASDRVGTRALPVEASLHSISVGGPLEMKGGNQSNAVHKGPVCNGLSAYGLTRPSRIPIYLSTNLSIYIQYQENE
jgi:hypothetical protein